jgi:trehalose 6-phosphate phosphatase
MIAWKPVERALYGGDDRTDVDAFTGLRTLERDGKLSTTVCVAVASEESPPEVSREADLVVPGPEGFVRVLETLARP